MLFSCFSSTSYPVTFCPLGALQDTVSDVFVAVALMSVAGPGSEQNHTGIYSAETIEIEILNTPVLYQYLSLFHW